MKKKYVQNFLLLISSILVSILFAEAFLQFIGIPSTGWFSKVSILEQNQHGFRGQKINYTNNDYIIVLLGDSQVEAKGCYIDWMPESRLEYHLNQNANQNKNIKVFSIGTAGYGQDQQLLRLQDYYVIHRADLVILWLTPTNDVWNNIFPTHYPKNGWPKPTFRLFNGELYGPNESSGEEFSWPKIKILNLANRLFKFIDRDGDWEIYLPQPYKPMSNYDGKICYDWQERWDNNFEVMRHENLDTEKSHYAISLTPISPRMHYGLDLTKALLREINRLVNGKNGKFVLFNTTLPPHGKQENCPEDEVVHLLNGKYYKTSKKQFHDNLEYIKAEFPSFTIPITIPKWRLGPDDSHLNEHANDQVMKDLATRLLPLIE